MSPGAVDYEDRDRLARQVGAVRALAVEPCENFTRGTCADSPDRSPGARLGAYRYCWPCRVRAAVDGNRTPWGH